jgi:hypothetical protein
MRDQRDFCYTLAVRGGILLQMIVSKPKNIFRILILLVLIGLVLAACSSKDQLLGVWSETDGDFHIRFHTGNFVSQKAYFDEDDVLSLTGTYEILNDNQLTLEFQEGDWRGIQSGVYDYSISGDALQLDDMTFERQPDVYDLE